MGETVVILGAGGRLGRELVNLFGTSGQALNHQDLEITDANAVREKLGELSPQLIINCAAVTDVDAAECHPEQAFNVNALGARNLAEAAREIDADLVYISTDYVFNGKKGVPYGEDDPPSPVNHYGRSKLTGEYITRHLWPKSYIIRTGILYGLYGTNYLQTLIDNVVSHRTITAVSDQTASPTSTADLARAIQVISSSGRYGTYHAVNAGRASRYELATMVLAEVNRYYPEIRDTTIKPISLVQAGKLAARPADTTLACAKLEQELAYPMRCWEEPVREYVNYYLRQKLSGRITGA